MSLGSFLFPFLSSIDLQKLSELPALRFVDVHADFGSIDPAGDLVRVLTARLLQSLQNLEILGIIGDEWRSCFNLEKILVSSLRELRLLAQPLSLWISDDTYNGQQLQAPEIDMILINGPNLTFLGLFVPGDHEHLEFLLDIFVLYDKLEALEIHVLDWITGPWNDDNAPHSDGDSLYNNAALFMHKLHTKKTGTPFRKVSIMVHDLARNRQSGSHPCKLEDRHDFHSRINEFGVCKQWGRGRCRDVSYEDISEADAADFYEVMAVEDQRG